ncbi:MAG TPA: SDR family oxidoreductase [Pseudogracilibacillus sp.]|nr:SDR family oxidoreductase [Pseudogracilibacillus sp.]
MKKNVLLLGASGDIGKAVAHTLAEQGHRLILHYYKNKVSIKELIHSLPEEAVLQTIQADLTDVEAVHCLCKEVAFSVHSIIYVSGMAQYGLFQTVLETEMDRMLMLHVKAPWYITQYFLPEMIQKQTGHLVFVTSIWGDSGASNEVIYSSVKGAQNSFVKALAKEVGPSGIRVNAVSPGFIDTKMNQHLQEAEMANIMDQIPLNRFGIAQDVAYMIDFLLDDKGSYIQGEVINISGGWY